MTLIDPADPARYIGGTVVHHRKHKPNPNDYFSTDEETLRDAMRKAIETGTTTILEPATVAGLRAKLAIQREQRLMPVGPDA